MNSKYAVTCSDDHDSVWCWNYEEHKLFYDLGEDVKLKIVEVKFRSPKELNKLINVANPVALEQKEELRVSKGEITTDIAMEIVGSFNQEGLGPTKWWN